MQRASNILRTTILAVAVMAAAFGAMAWENVLLPKVKTMDIAADGSVATVAQCAAVHVAYVESVAGVPERCQNEAYRLEISAKGVAIQATSHQGALWARATLAQVLAGAKADGKVPCCKIVDWPEFSVRGILQDIGRAYIPVEEIKAEIDNISKFKMNVFHWHLTENDAWRLESKAYPQLTKPETMTRQKGKFYTLKEFREVVDYAYERGVMVLPEIDMPGHSAAFVRALGYKMDTAEGVKTLKTILRELAEAGGDKVKIIHLGTDETGFDMPDFVPEMVGFVRKELGKQVWAYNPGWQFKPGEIDALQLWSYRGQAVPGIPAIDCKLHYINHYDTYADVVALYNSTIYRQTTGSDQLLGSIVCLWHDTPVETWQDMVKQNGLYPSALAIGERTWMGGGMEYFDGRGAVLYDDDSEVTRNFIDFDGRLTWHLKHTLKGVPVLYVSQRDAHWSVTDAFPNGGDLAKAFPPEQGEWKDSFEYNGMTYGTHRVLGNGFYLRHVWGEEMVKGLYEKPQPNSTAYALRKIYSPAAKVVNMYIETQNYSRSERDKNPPAGAWDYRKSWIKVNGELVPAPKWIEHERGFVGNENSTAREPIKVKLRKGWNTILVKLPVGEFRTDEVRLVKWALTLAVEE